MGRIKGLSRQARFTEAVHTGPASDLPKVPFLQRRGARWTYRRRVPEDLRNALGKTEIIRRLDGSSHEEAAVEARAMATKDDADFRLAQLRQTPTDEIQLSDGDLRALTFAFFHEADQQAIEALSGPADAPAGGIALSAAEIVSERQADLAMLAGAGDDRSDEVIDVAGLANVAEAVLAAEGIAVDPPLPAPPPGVIQHRAQAPERLTYSHV